MLGFGRISVERGPLLRVAIVVGHIEVGHAKESRHTEVISESVAFNLSEHQ